MRTQLKQRFREHMTERCISTLVDMIDVQLEDHILDFLEYEIESNKPTFRETEIAKLRQLADKFEEVDGKLVFTFKSKL